MESSTLSQLLKLPAGDRAELAIVLPIHGRHDPSRWQFDRSARSCRTDQSSMQSG